MSDDADFPVTRCARCDRDVLTHVHFDDDGGEHRLCYHCDTELDPETLRWVPETALAALGYGLHLDNEAGCGRPGCGKGNCANRI